MPQSKFQAAVTVLYILCAALAAACFYAAASHQRLFRQTQNYKLALRACGGLLSVVALVIAAQLLGLWAGIFAALTTLMLGCVVLPYVDAWRTHRGERHVE